MSSGTELRSYPAGIASYGNNERKVVVPRYLRASTGSCHDFCKYGRMDVQEAKEKLSMIKRAGRRSLSRSSEDSIGGITISVAKQKASLDSKPTKMSKVKNSDSLNSVPQISDASDKNKLEIPSKSSRSQKQIGNKAMKNTAKASSVRVQPSFLPKSHISLILETRKGEISSSFEAEIPSKPTFKRVESSPAATSERVKTHPKLTSQLVKASSKSISTMKQASSKVSCCEDKEMLLSEKHATSVKTISSMNSSEGLGGQRISKMKKRETSPNSSSGGIGSVSARKHKGLKIVPHLMNQPAIEVEPEEHNKEAQEKTLYVIKMESANQSSQSDQNESQEIESPLSNSISQTSSQEDQKESDYANTEFEEDVFPQNHELEYLTIVDTLETEENEKPQKDVEVVFSEDKDCQKLSGELDETQIDKDNLKSLKIERGEVLRDNATDSKAAALTCPEKVVLKCQDVQDKKDGEGLYNNVIEETASNLVETRKGRVKALIDAFEKRTLANTFN
ncbi:hypothetical protein PHAVU_008G035900 [Phaseolus vulgaris]|uniref:Calmodulin-binding domain-containing protein n=1 Tax=Phaseolus vulgaris TaxID=3885 RepID=V7B1R1_PHAVU|nr:hypothetical protein PHAVU_008G035900g [Phaseolus vulgaris]XP_007139511.1 hypothetical protein PHAVU_008G035900g [Phaseolus vulgaris]ESW11504.1 hypothetical protein PHAVU_008G035900g [Phaseolus vulgaris]ESW11505.1 hypothetical protein PHAVU_008G035900g [Phaseolus vulgaris]